MKVSVIIPFYKVEQFIQRCATSLFEQTLQEVEYIFVDDASPDNSRGVLEECIQKYPNRNIQIITHPENKGLPAARNTGLAEATGEYVYHCDSDDFVEPTMLEDLYNTAIRKQADYVWCDWLLSYDKTERYMKQPDLDSSQELLQELLRGGMKYNVWNKLVKRDLYVQNDIVFPSGHSMGEDMTMIKLAACSERVAYIAKAYYHYVRTNAEAMTQHWTERHLRDIRLNVDSLLNFMYDRLGRDNQDLERDLAIFKLNIKLPFLISTDWEDYRRWNDWYPEADNMIGENNRFSCRTKLIQKWAHAKCYRLLWVYNKVVYSFIYRLIYH